MLDRIRLYRELLRVRMVEEEIAERYPRWNMRCPVHLSIGQEAAAVGVCSMLRREDRVMSGHRSHAHYLAKGGDLQAMLLEIHGKADGCSGGRGGSMHLLDREAGFQGAVPIVGSTIPIATGLAFADKLAGRDCVTAVFFGEAATEEGVFAESLNFAALHHLRVLFVCENNLYSVYSPMEVRQPAERSITAIALAHGIAAKHADGNDIDLVRQATDEALRQMASTPAPQLLLLDTYRWREHCGHGFDNHIGYRSEEEYLNWKKRDPVLLYQQRLAGKGLLNEDDQQNLSVAIATEITTAFSHAEAAPFPTAEDLLSHSS
jgi:TPP-dependent pyruvate/acetoin dehydrogenase alpha subunit